MTADTGTTTISQRKRCGAKKTGKDSYCTLWPLKGSKRCKWHGGASLKGIASPTFKTGRYSKYLPTGLSERYSAALDDPNLVGLRDEIALVTSLIDERIEKLYSGESAGMWKLMLDMLSEYKTLTDNADPSDDAAMADAAARLAEIQTVAREGFNKFAAYEQIESMLEQRRKLIESETKRLKELDQNITVDKAVGIIQLLVSIVRKHVTDRKQLQAISTELAAAVN